MQTTSNTPESSGNGHGAQPRVSVIANIDASQAEASRELHAFLADVETLIQEATTMTGVELGRAKAKIRERTAAAKRSMLAMGDTISDRARAGVNATNGYVHEQPWQAIGVGAALGLLVGFALARR